MSSRLAWATTVGHACAGIYLVVAVAACEPAPPAGPTDRRPDATVELDTSAMCVAPAVNLQRVGCQATRPCCDGYACSPLFGYCVGCPTGRPCVTEPSLDAGAPPARDAGLDAGPAPLLDSATVAPIDAADPIDVPRVPGDTSGTDTGVTTMFDAGVDAGVDAGPRPTWWQPGPGTTWQIQLDGASIDTSFDVDAYEVDLIDTPAAEIAGLRGAGRAVICYFTAGGREGWRADASSYPMAVIGSLVVGAPEENWLDIRHPFVRMMVERRLDLAVTKGCTAVDADKVDGYLHDARFGLTAADQLAFNRFVAAEAHQRGLAIGLKNDAAQAHELVADFDFALPYDCVASSTCAQFVPFIMAGKAVLHAETGTATFAAAACPMMNALNFDTIFKDVEVTAARLACR